MGGRFCGTDERRIHPTKIFVFFFVYFSWLRRIGIFIGE